MELADARVDLRRFLAGDALRFLDLADPLGFLRAGRRSRVAFAGRLGHRAHAEFGARLGRAHAAHERRLREAVELARELLLVVREERRDLGARVGVERRDHGRAAKVERVRALRESGRRDRGDRAPPRERVAEGVDLHGGIRRHRRRELLDELRVDLRGAREDPAAHVRVLARVLDRYRLPESTRLRPLERRVDLALLEVAERLEVRLVERQRARDRGLVDACVLQHRLELGGRDRRRQPRAELRVRRRRGAEERRCERGGEEERGERTAEGLEESHHGSVA